MENDKVLLRELDELEEELYAYDSMQEIFRRTSYWLTKRLNCAFILFFADHKDKNGDRVRYYGEQVHSYFVLGTVVDERLEAEKKDPDLSFKTYMHPKGSLSRRLSYSTEEEGCLFLGPNIGGISYTQEQARLLKPVCRIVQTALIRLEARLKGGESRRLMKDREKIRLYLGRYISPDVVDSMIEGDSFLVPEAEKKCLSILFSEIENFSYFSQKLSPSALIKFLDIYFTEMSQLIISLGGCPLIFGHCGIKGVFGAPRSLVDHAARACSAALRMKKMERLLNEHLLREKIIDLPFKTSTGISTGDIIFGKFGKASHADYVTIGKTVEIAEKIEKCNESEETSLLTGESTYQMVKDFFVFREVKNTLSLKENENIHLYELLGEKEGALPDYSSVMNLRHAGELEELE